MKKVTPVWNESRNRWEARLQVDGSRRLFTSKVPGKKGQAEVIRKVEAFSVGAVLADLTVNKAWVEYLEDVLARSSSENYRNIECFGRLYILPVVGKKKLMSLTPVKWQACINNAKSQTGEPLAKKTLQNIRGTISAFITYCHRAGYVENRDLSLYIPVGHEIKSKEVLQPDQVRRMFTDEVSGDWFVNCWRFMLLTGLRPGEALGLQWSDIANECITIKRSVNSRGQLTPGKNKNARRLIPLSELALNVLADQKKKTEELGSEWVFCNHYGDMPKQSITFDYYKRTAAVLGAPATSPYSLRHTFVSMLKNAIPEQMLKSIVGHSVSMDTFGVYGHTMEGDQQALSAALNSFFGASRITSEELPSESSGVQITRLGAAK